MGYMAAHNRTRRVRGSARDQACIQCGDPAREWGLSRDAIFVRRDWHGVYSDSPSDYLPMCLRCHRLYDKEAITHCPKGHEYAGENLLMDAGKRKCRTCVYERNRRRQRERGLTPEQRARKSQLQRERRQQARGEVA